MDSVRSVYTDIGPRMKGGSLDLKYNELDRVFLDVLEQRARDPRYAALMGDILGAERVRMDGSPGRLGSLAQTHAHASKVRSIMDTARRTLADTAQKVAEQNLALADREAYRKGDGSAGAITDFRVPNPADPSKEIVVTKIGRAHV